MTLNYSEHYVAIRDHLIDCARLDPVHAIAAARQHERDARGSLAGLVADVQGAIADSTVRAGRAQPEPMETT